MGATACRGSVIALVKKPTLLCTGGPVHSSKAMITQADPVTVPAGVKIFHTKTLVPLLSVIRLLSWNSKELEFPQCHAGRRKREKLVCQEEISLVLTMDTIPAGERDWRPELRQGWFRDGQD